jgi:hypothetical protein
LYPDTPEPTYRKGFKHTECPFYVTCLTYAVKQKWEYWSCSECPNQVLAIIYKRLQFIEQYYPTLAEIYPEFRRKYERFMESYDSIGAC